MKTKQLISGLLIATSLLTAMPVFAEVQNDTVSANKVEQNSYHSTVLKNPIYIDGVTYADGDFIKEAFNLKYLDKSYIIREDKTIVIHNDKPFNTYPRVNGAYSGDYSVVAKTYKGKVVYPIRFLAEQFCSELKYDQKTGSITVIDKGLLQIARTTERFNTIKGRVIGFDGKPAEGVTVHLYESGKIVYTSTLDSVTNERCPGHYIPIAITDKDGYYEFNDIDTDLVPFVSLSIQHETYKGIEISGCNAGGEANREFLATVTQDMEFNNQLPSLMVGIYSDRLEMPTIYLYRL